MLDAHCHLDDPRIEADEALARAAAVGVVGAVIAGYGPERWPVQRRLVREHRNLWACYGVHPWRLDDLRQVDELEPWLDEAVGLGELGLDRVRGADRALQRKAFARQLALARERNLPVVLHVVRAHGEVLQTLRKEGLPAAGGMVHGFAGSPEVAREYLDLGLHLSFGRRLSEAAAHVPGDRLLVETDCPDGAPEGPAALVRHAEALAAARAEPAGALLQRSADNLCRLFRLEER